MKAMTVAGPVDADQLGVTLPHEHVIIDLSFLYQESSIAGLPVGAIDRKVLRLNPAVSKDNLVLGDPELSVQELSAFKEVGGSSVVDLTLSGLGRNPRVLREISGRSGVNIICGTGWNVESTHPKLVKQGSVDDLAKAIRSELTGGIDGTSIQAGIIGEIGITGPITPGEERVLRAAARAQRMTGAAIVIDTLPLQEEKYAFKALDILEEEETDLSRIVVAHVDFNDGLDEAYVKALLDRGVYAEFDGFGTERPDYSEWLKGGPRLMLPTDAERVKAVRNLTENGYARRILLSHDTCMKWEYSTYGGAGYGHILQRIVPALREAGVSENEVNSMLIDSPRFLLAYLR
jgi:phosphotriesterase-related protein